MYKGVVTTPFVDRHTRRPYRVGDTYIAATAKRRDEIIAAGEAKGAAYVRFEDTSPVQPDGDPRLKAVGGGWYELPNGERVRGRDAALEELAELDAVAQGSSDDDDAGREAGGRDRDDGSGESAGVTGDENVTQPEESTKE